MGNIFKFEMGEFVKDTVTGYEGKITGRYEFLSYQNRYLVEAIDSTGRPIEWTIDEDRLTRE